MRYLITGTTGLVGSEIVNYLSKTNNSIRCLIHNAKLPVKNKHIQLYKGDITNNKSLNKVCKNVDIIIHCAALINGKDKNEYLKTNYIGTKNILNQAANNKVKKFVYISSWSTDIKSGDYSLSKLLAEQYVKHYKNYLIIKPADIYSFKKSHIHSYIKSLQSYPITPVVGNGNYLVSPIYSTDLVKAIFVLIKSNEKISTVTGPQIFTFNQFNKLIKTHYKQNKQSLKIPIRLLKGIAKLKNYIPLNMPIDEERLDRMLGDKIIVNGFNFKKYSIEPLEFKDALPKLKLR